MENQEKETNKKKRGRKEIPPEKRRRNISTVVSPEIFQKLTDDIEKGFAPSRGQRILQIVEKFYREEDERNPPW